MRFLLDTCVLSDFSEGHPLVLERVKASAPEDLAVSTLTEMEVDYGLLLKPGLRRRLKPAMDAFFEAVRVVPYDRKAAQATALARANQKRRGKPIRAYDLLIAGTALAHELILVTSNVREFAQVEGLKLEDWRTRT